MRRGSIDIFLLELYSLLACKRRHFTREFASAPLLYVMREEFNDLTLIGVGRSRCWGRLVMIRIGRVPTTRW